jgi:hypothetical protein
MPMIGLSTRGGKRCSSRAARRLRPSTSRRTAFRLPIHPCDEAAWMGSCCLLESRLSALFCFWNGRTLGHLVAHVLRLVWTPALGPFALR